MDFLASLDQMRAMLRDFSPVIFSYYADLKKQGFTDEQAFELAKEMQKGLFRNAN